MIVVSFFTVVSFSTVEDAWRCVDDVAGTSVDTFVYMVQRGDGLFYNSRVGRQFGSDMVDSGFWLVAFYRAWHNMKSLEARGLDPLTVIIDRSHEKNMGKAAHPSGKPCTRAVSQSLLPCLHSTDRAFLLHVISDFIASYRVNSYLGMEELIEFERSETDNALNQPLTPGALAMPEVRDHQFAILRELMTDYTCDGLELDFGMLTTENALPPGMKGSELAPVLTEWIGSISA